ncbi:hypothetical protein AX15_006640 [Amanita polypyramis BW_CC]|nr:hypothetical protein AX15_006640 [Amanita polypyramis BW_CC]
MNKALLQCLSTRHLKEMANHGPAALWESLAESDYSGEYEHLAEICEHVFPFFVAIPEDDAEQLATQLGLQILEKARAIPPNSSNKEDHPINTPPRTSAPAEPATPKAIHKPHFTNPAATSHQMTDDTHPDTSADMPVDTISPELAQSGTILHTVELISSANSLISQLQTVWQKAANIQGNSADIITDNIISAFHLKGKGTLPIYTPQPVRPTTMPPSWTLAMPHPSQTNQCGCPMSRPCAPSTRAKPPHHPRATLPLHPGPPAAPMLPKWLPPPWPLSAEPRISSNLPPTCHLLKQLQWLTASHPHPQLPNQMLVKVLLSRAPRSHLASSPHLPCSIRELWSTFKMP